MTAGNPSLDTLFCAAVEIASAEERAAYLARACGSDPELRARVEKLVTAHFRAGNFLAAPVPAARLVATVEESLVAERPGTLIGPYKLLEQIGEGGMGLVFVAEQQRPVRRRVALKLIKPGMDSRQIVARFEAERQALALMDHPNIAKVHDGGTAENGRPYFVMELVKGLPITDFCDQNCLTTRQRLGLFLDVCAAVQHAHQKGVIHRDLKPSNIMVTVHDVTPVVKVIDFGIAKATGAQLTDQTIYTHFAQMLGTPLYMSPEQVGLSGLDVDTRSDVYSLGVLLYELLTGTTPFVAAALKQAGHDELRRIIREDEPARPSARLSTLGKANLSTVAERRGADPRKLSQAVRGELDWIVMRCLEKDRNRRYESASALAADVRRYLNDEAVAACPPSAGYRLRKFARRNRRTLVTAGVITVALVAATTVSAWQAVVARDAQHQAEADRKQAEADRKQAEADRDRAMTAERQAKTDQDRAQTAERRAATEAAIARAVNDFLQGDLLGQVMSTPRSGQERAGGSHLTVREALDRAAARIGQRFKDQPLVEAAIRQVIGNAYHRLHKTQLAIPHLERAFVLRKAHLGAEHPDTLASLQSFATTCSEGGRQAEGITLHQQILENRKKMLGPNHPETLERMRGLAGAYETAGQWDASVPLLEQVLEKQRTICGPTHPHTLGTMHQLAINYWLADRLEDSMALHENVLGLFKSTHGPDHESTHSALDSYAQVCQQAGDLDRAERLFRDALKIARKRDGTNDERLGTANTLSRLAQTLLLQKRYAAAEPLVREAVAIFEKEEPYHPERFRWVSLLGEVIFRQQKYAEAEPLLLQGYEGLKQMEATLNAKRKLRLAEMGEGVIRFYEVTNQPEKARAWGEKLSPK